MAKINYLGTYAFAAEDMDKKAKEVNKPYYTLLVLRDIDTFTTVEWVQRAPIKFSLMNQNRNFIKA